MKHSIYFKILLQIITFLFLGISLFANNSNCEGPTAVNLIISKNVNNAAPNPEEIFTYTIRYRCASLTEHCINTQIQDALPADMEIVSYTSVGGQVGAASNLGNTITWKLQTPGSPDGQLDAGSTGMVIVKARFACDSGATTASNPYTNTATISADNGASASSSIDVNLTTDAPVCPTIPAPPAVLSKTQSNEEWTINANASYHLTFPPHSGNYTVVDNISPNTIVYVVDRAIDGAASGTSGYTRLRIQCANSGEWFTIWDFGTGSATLNTPSEIPASALECISVSHPDFPNQTFFNITAVEWTIDGAALSSNEDISHALRVSAPETNPFDGMTVNYTSGGSGTALPNWTEPLANTSISNCITASEPTIGTACDQETFLETGPLVSLEKGLIGAPNIPYPTLPSDFGTPPVLSETITLGPSDLAFGLEIGNQLGGYWVENLEIVDLLDENLEFDPSPSGNNWWVMDIRDSDWSYDTHNPYVIPECWTPKLTIEKDWNGTGKTLLKWSFDPACKLPPYTTEKPKIWIFYTASIKPGTVAGTVIENMHMGILPANALLTDCDGGGNTGPEHDAYWPSIIDEYDLDGDGDFTESICRGNVVSYTVPTLSDLSSSKWVKGSLDSDFSRYPNTGNTDIKGEGTYELFIENTGNINVTQLDVVDILPHIGDNDILGVVGTRDSDWEIELVNDIVVERWNDGSQEWDGVLTADISGGLLYSTSTNPCRFINATTTYDDLIADNTAVGPTGCTSTPWGTSATGANSFAFKFIPSSPFAPGERLKITVNVRINGNPPGCTTPDCSGGGDVLNSGAISWNSFAFGGVYNNGSPNRLLDSEPIKVGLKMIDLSTKTSLGNLVWIDANANGIQDAGEAGIENVTVSLWDAAGTTKIDSTITNADGFYTFYGLDPSTTYLIRLDNPMDHLGVLGAYSLTLQNDPNAIGGGLDLDDSDASLNGDGYPEISATTGTVTGIDDPRDPTEYPSFDFGFFIANTVGNFIWYDLNAIGDYKNDEPSVQGVQVSLYSVGLDGAIGGGDDIQVGTTQTTGSDGLYLFDAVPDGTYYVHFDISAITGIDPITGLAVIPTDWCYTSAFNTGDNLTDSNADASSGNSDIFTLKGGERNLSIDAGIKSAPTDPATIEGMVWADLDNDGVRDAGEYPISGVEVILLDNNGLPVASTFTDGLGEYSFAGLEHSQAYQVVFKPKSTVTIALQDQGGNDSMDSDVNSADGTTPSVTPAANETISNIDAGLIIPPTIGNFVWKDTDADGIQDAGELGISGVTVTLHDMDNGGAIVGTAITDANGYYQFGGYKNVNMELISYTSNKCVSIKITDRYDDVEERLTHSDPSTIGNVSRTNYDIELGFDGATTQQMVGLRFQNVKIPQGATINSANIQFSSDDDSTVGSGACTVTIKGELIAKAPAFTSTQFDVSSRTPTSATGTWTVPDWSANLERGPLQLTSDFGPVVKEIVDLGDWASGNSMVFMITGTDERETEAFDEYPEHAAELTVCYDETLYNEQPLLANRNYEVRVALNQPFVKTYELTLSNTGANTSNSSTTDINDSDASDVSGNALITLLTEGQSSRNDGFDYGFAEKATIQGYTWYDIDNDGTREGGETLLEGVTVDLYTSGGAYVATTTTLGNGYYQFDNITPGDYYIIFDETSNTDGTVFLSGTLQETNSSSDIEDANDSDSDPATKQTPVFTASLSEDKVNIDAGFVTTSLPVELISFKGVSNNCNIELQWITASEENNSHFIIEYSTNGQDFTPLSNILGNGTSSEMNTYSFVHKNIESAKNYYRLKQIDFNGSYSYSNILLIDADCKSILVNQISMHPNPTKGNVNIQIDSQIDNFLEVIVTDATGKLIENRVIELNKGVNSEYIDLERYNSGSYFITFINNNGFKQTFNVIKI